MLGAVEETSALPSVFGVCVWKLADNDIASFPRTEEARTAAFASPTPAYVNTDPLPTTLAHFAAAPFAARPRAQPPFTSFCSPVLSATYYIIHSPRVEHISKRLFHRMTHVPPASLQDTKAEKKGVEYRGQRRPL